MRLLQYNNNSWVFSEHDNNPPPYAILSHTWSENNEEEVTYQDIRKGTTKSFNKLLLCRDWAHAAGYSYFWIDTCCIDKRNEAELAYAIRSMYQWYSQAAICFVYLPDVTMTKRKAAGSDSTSWEESFRGCRWFTRGWTLQELIAPHMVEFYARDGHLGSKETLIPLLKDITKIDLASPMPAHHTRLNWIADRETRKPEDKAYCMMGICGVLMSPQYGEGEYEARRRLEVAIVQRHGLDSTVDAPASKDHGTTIMDLLKFEAMESRRTTISAATKKTCEWILDHPTCIQWQQLEHSFFWIQGKPGVGKSVMVKFLEQHITSKMKNVLRLSFYFTARGEQLEKTFAGMYRSLLVQLLQAAPELSDILDKVQPSRALNTVQLQSVLAEGVRKLDQRLFIFIDAVDECQDNDVREMIDFFENLQCGAAVVSVCFASRHYPVHEIPTRLQLILEDAIEHTADLEQYVRENLRLGNGTQSQRQNIWSEIVEKANGVFLWVILVIKILQKEVDGGRLHAVQTRLREIPEGLKELFQDIIGRDRDNMDEFILCLRWILYAKRPLKLPEFHFAMMAGLTTKELKWDPEDRTEEQMHAFLLTSSKGFAELAKGKESSTAQFIHESVRDYLVKDNGFRAICGDTDEALVSNAHEQLKQCCSRGLAFEIPEYQTAPKKGPTLLGEEQRRDLVMIYPFAEYATLHILYHANQAADAVPQQHFLDSEFSLPQWTAKFNAFQRHKTRCYIRIPSWNYICAESDSARLLTRPYNALSREKKQRYGTPLCAAFSCSSWDVGRVFLQEMDILANVDQIIAEAMASRVAYEATKNLLRVPWAWAVANGLEHLAKCLLRSVTEAEITRKSKSGLNAFHLAISSGNLAIVKHIWTMCPTIAHVATGGSKEGLHPLQLAAAHGRDGIVEFLLTHDTQRITQTLNLYNKALQEASHNGHEKVVKLLVAAGANVNSSSNSGTTALVEASRGGHIKVVKLLLDYGGKEVNTALLRASQMGLLEMMTLLLNNGAEVNAQKDDGGNALHAACASYLADIEVVKLLLDKGAEVNAQGGRCGNALQAACAASRADIEIVKLLLDRGADIDVQGGYWGNALQAASFGGCLETVKLLLDQGAEINAQGGNYGNALQAASYRGQLEMVKLLLYNGAEDIDGGALRIASKRGCPEIFELLKSTHGVHSSCVAVDQARAHLYGL